MTDPGKAARPSRRGKQAAGGRDFQPEFPFPPDAPSPSRPGRKRRLPARVRIALAGAALVVGLAAAGAVLFKAVRPDCFPGRPPAGPPPAATPPTDAEPPWTTVETIVERGKTLSAILSENGLPAPEIDRLVKAAKPVFDFKRIVAGRRMKISFDGAGALRALEYPVDERSYILVTSEGGAYETERKAYPFEVRPAYVDGVIRNSLYEAVVGRKESPTLSWRLEELFGWDIDFWAGLREGDAFRLIVEKHYLDGEFAGYGHIPAAEFWNQGGLYRAFRFEYPDTKKADHFDAGGGSLRKEFLKSPLLGRGRLTSRFSFSRLHPIRKVYRAHYGVDYAAPVGTPVYATADGTVLETGARGAAGRMIRLRHKNNFETSYLHLSRILVKKGDKVRSGQQIGTVGSTGESTGPHLDYRIKEGGVYVNPLAKKFAPVEPLRPEFGEAFRRVMAVLAAALDAPMAVFRK
ncbi:MAG: hypothetical protein FJY82_02440 [Candidatus Aminicenantes bacterium]|nr:hypothetical protein [Candidatus Aminicenantes bacterium]